MIANQDVTVISKDKNHVDPNYMVHSLVFSIDMPQNEQRNRDLKQYLEKQKQKEGENGETIGVSNLRSEK